jgi:hypothetical protein
VDHPGVQVLAGLFALMPIAVACLLALRFRELPLGENPYQECLPADGHVERAYGVLPAPRRQRRVDGNGRHHPSRREWPERWFRGDHPAAPAGVGAGEAAAARSRTRIREMIDGQMVLTAFQPIYSLAGGHLNGVKALRRFRYSRVPTGCRPIDPGLSAGCQPCRLLSRRRQGFQH